MSASILDYLMNAQDSLKVDVPTIKLMGLDQLDKAIALLEKGYNVYTEVAPLLEKYGDIDSIPDIED